MDILKIIKDIGQQDTLSGVSSTLSGGTSYDLYSRRNSENLRKIYSSAQDSPSHGVKNELFEGIGMGSPLRIAEKWKGSLERIDNNQNLSFVNPVSGMGGSGDLSANFSGRNAPPYMHFGFLDNVYRENFLLRNAVDIPADDITRESRIFSSSDHSVSGDDLQRRKDAEEDLDVQGALNNAIKWARLYGGSAILIGVKGQKDLSQPLDVDGLGKGCIKTLNVFFKDQITPTGILDSDPLSPTYGQVAYYALTTFNSDLCYDIQMANNSSMSMQSLQRDLSGIKSKASLKNPDLKNRDLGSGLEARSMFIHRSRLIIFNGYTLPFYAKYSTLYWDDSILVPSWGVLNTAEQVWSSAAQLLLKSNIDVIYTENYLNILKDNPQEVGQIANGIKKIASNYNMMFLDKSMQSLERNELNVLSGVKEIVDTFIKLVSMSFKMPISKIASGLNIKGSSSSDSDLVIYYDHIKQIQKSMGPQLRHLDKLVEISTFGKLMGFRYRWGDLYSTSPAQRAAIEQQHAQSRLIYLNAGIIGREDVRRELLEEGTFSKITAKDLINVGEGDSLVEIPDHGDRFKKSVQRSGSIKEQIASPISESK